MPRKPWSGLGERGSRMPRPMKRRRVHCKHHTGTFTPAGNPDDREPIRLKIDEIESLRLMDLEHLDQAACAEMMGLARTTFQRVLHSAREKVALALIERRPLVIEGIETLDEHVVYHCPACKKDLRAEELNQGDCPNCSS